MKGSVVYIHHSCFILEIEERKLVFDIPARSHLTPLQLELIERHIRGREVIAFFSHGHEDHFNPEVRELLQSARTSQVVASFDVAREYPNALPSSSLIVEPEEEYSLGGISISTFESNDQGVAYLLSIEGKNIYYGGDLALWIWPDTPAQAAAMIRAYFEDIMEELRSKGIDIAFTNWDPRLENLAGGDIFLSRVRPRYFVPMHTFGKCHILDKIKKIDLPETTIPFIYGASGDSIPIRL